MTRLVAANVCAISVWSRILKSSGAPGAMWWRSRSRDVIWRIATGMFSGDPAATQTSSRSVKRLLLLVPFVPSFGAAACVLLARHVLSQMDVPTRQAYSMALVTPDERPAAGGLTASTRALAQACAPFVSGLTMAAAATPFRFLIAGGLKIVYDLSLFFRFRSLPLGSPLSEA